MTTSPDKVSVSLSSNYLQVNKKFLVAQQLNEAELANLNEKKQRLVDPEQLHRIITLGHDAIIRASETFRDKIVANNPNSKAPIPYPWINTIRLCEFGREPEVLSPTGLVAPYETISSTEHNNIDNITTPLQPYWEAADSTDFLVRVQSHQQGWDRIHDGTWLQIHQANTISE